MPYKPKRPCNHPGCPGLTNGRLCTEHAKVAAQTYERYKRNPGNSKRYGSGWRKARRKFNGEHPLCALCQSHGKFTEATVARHIKAATDGKSNDEENLIHLTHIYGTLFHDSYMDPP